MKRIMTWCAIAMLALPAVARAEGEAEKAQQMQSRAMEFLKKEQQPDGSWQRSPQEPPGISALALRAFVGGGSFSTKDDFIKKGYDKLLSNQKPTGEISSDMLATYNTAIAASAIAAANDPAMKDALDKTITWLKKTQWAEGATGPKGETVNDKSNNWYGGFGYGRHARPDLSNSHFAIAALQDARLKPGDPAYERAMVFVSRCQNLSETNDQKWSGNDGGFVYSGANEGDSEAESYDGPDGKKMWRSYGSMTYAGLKSMIYAGVKKDDPRVRAAVSWIQSNWTLDQNPGMGAHDPANAQNGLYYYYMVMAKALNAYDEPTITDSKGAVHDWRVEMIAKLSSLQKPDGSFAGDKRWMESNPVLVTSYVADALNEIQVDLKEHPIKSK